MIKLTVFSPTFKIQDRSQYSSFCIVLGIVIFYIKKSGKEKKVILFICQTLHEHTGSSRASRHYYQVKNTSGYMQ